MIKSLSLLFSLLFVTNSVYADHYSSKNVETFYSYEANGEDYISSVGIAFTKSSEKLGLGYQVTTQLNYAEVLATDGYLEDFFAWEAGVKFGLFSQIQLYGEVGIDLSELFFHDLRYDSRDDYRYHDNIDAYAGIGAGINAGPFSIKAFSRLREIDSRHWEADSEVFTGVQFSINF